VTSQGATLGKNAAGTALIGRLVHVANALHPLYKSEGDPTEAAKMHRNPTDYRNMGELVLATEARDLNQRAAARAKDLADYGLSAAYLKALDHDATSFEGLLDAPELAIDAGKNKGATDRATLSALNRFLQDDLRSGLELLKTKQPDAYRALREAAQVDDAGSRKSQGGSSAPTA
jgi:hypothetical protein